MNPLQRALIEKAGHDHGFEYVQSADDAVVVLASARHPAQVAVQYEPGCFVLSFSSPAKQLLHTELTRTFPGLHRDDRQFSAPDMDALSALLVSVRPSHIDSRFWRPVVWQQFINSTSLLSRQPA